MSTVFQSPTSTPTPQAAPPAPQPTDDDTVSMDEAIEKLRVRFGIPKVLADKLIRQESGGNDSAKSYAGAIGRMQLMSSTARGILKPNGQPVDPNNPLENVYGGFKYLSDNYKAFRGRAKSDRHAWMMAAGAYHAGPQAVEDDLKRGGLGIPDTDDGLINTRDYVFNIFNGTKPEDFSVTETPQQNIDVPIAPNRQRDLNLEPTTPTQQIDFSRVQQPSSQRAGAQAGERVARAVTPQEPQTVSPQPTDAKFSPNVNYTQQPFDLTRLAPMSPTEAATEYMRHFGAQAGLKDKYLEAFVAQAIKEGGADFTYTQGEKKGQPISREDFESIKKTGFAGVDVRDSVKSLAEGYLKAQKSPTIEPYTPTFSENYIHPAERFLGANTQEGIKTTAAEELARSAIDTATFGAVRLPHVSDARIHNERERQLVDLGGQVGNVLGVAVPFAATSHLVASALRIPALASLVSALEESGAAGRALVRGVQGAATFGGVQAGREITNVPYGESKGLVEAAKNVGREAIIGGVSQGLTPPEAGALRAGATFAGTAAGTDVLEGKDLGQTGVDALKNLVVALALHRDTPEDVKAEAEGLLKDAVKSQPKGDEQAEAISPPVTSTASVPETSTEATTVQARPIVEQRRAAPVQTKEPEFFAQRTNKPPELMSAGEAVEALHLPDSPVSARDAHRFAIGQAIKEGKPVSASALIVYDDLRAQAESAGYTKQGDVYAPTSLTEAAQGEQKVIAKRQKGPVALEREGEQATLSVGEIKRRMADDYGGGRPLTELQAREALWGYFTGEGLRRALKLPDDFPLPLLERAGLVRTNEEGLYEFTDEVRGEVKQVGRTPAAQEEQRVIAERQAESGAGKSESKSATGGSEVSSPKPASVQNEEAAQKTDAQVKAAKLPKEIEEVITNLPDSVKAQIDVRGFKVVDFPPENQGEGGRYDPRSKVVYIEKDEPDPDVFLHETLHNYTEKLIDPKFVQDYIRARYPKTVADEELAKDPKDFFYNYFSIENITNDLTSYFRGQKLSPELKRVFDDYYHPPEPAPVQQSNALRARKADVLRSEGGSLADYDRQVQAEWLGKGTRFITPVPDNGRIKVYRATPEGYEIQDGDYVTTSKAYAEYHIESNLGGEGKITEREVGLDEIYPADAPSEFWFASKQSAASKSDSPTHHELQPRRQRNVATGTRGQFKSETKGQREARQAQMSEGPLIDRQRYQDTMMRNGSEYGIESEADIPPPEEAYQTFKDEYAAVKTSIAEYESQLTSGKRLRESARRSLEAKADSARERLGYLEEHAGNLFGERAAKEITGNVGRETKQESTTPNSQAQPKGLLSVDEQNSLAKEYGEVGARTVNDKGNPKRGASKTDLARLEEINAIRERHERAIVQLTPDEYADRFKGGTYKDSMGREFEHGGAGKGYGSTVDYRYHQHLVREALKRGEDVPDHVLAFYPELAKQYGKTSESTEINTPRPEGRQVEVGQEGGNPEGETRKASGQDKTRTEKKGADNTARVVQYLKDPDIGGSAQLENIAEDLGLTNDEATSAVLGGEMSGELRQLPGRRFQLIDSSASGQGEKGASPQLIEAYKAWTENRAYIDGAGNYHVRPESATPTRSQRGPIAPWNKLVKGTFKDSAEFHRAAQEYVATPKEGEGRNEQPQASRSSDAEKRSSLSEPTMQRTPQPATVEADISRPTVEATPKGTTGEVAPAPRVTGAKGEGERGTLNLGRRRYEKATTPVLQEVERITQAESQKTRSPLRLRERVQTSVTSQFTPLRSLESRLYGDKKIQGVDLARKFEQVAGAPAKAQADVIEFRRNVVDPVRENADDFNSYLFLSRVADRLAHDPEGKRVASWTPEKTQKGLEELKSKVGAETFGKFEEAGKAYQAEMRKALRLQVDSGRMSEDLYQQIVDSSDFYAPFKVLKYIEQSEASPAGTGRRIATTQALTKKITGIDSEDFQVGNLLQASAEQIVRSRVLAEKNLKMLELDKLADLDPDGKLIKRVEQGEHPRRGYELVRYFKDGKESVLEVEKPVAQAIQGLNVQESGLLARAAMLTRQPLRWGATSANAGFQAVNLFFADLPRAAILSKYGVRSLRDVYQFPMDWAYSLYTSMKGNFGKPNDLFMDWLKSGAANSTIQREITPEAFRETLGFGRPSVRRIPKGVLDSLAKFSNAIEETSKILGLRRGMRIEGIANLPPTEAKAATDRLVTEVRNYSGSPDFARSGKDTKSLNLLFMFFNARLQGMSADLSRLAGRTGGRESAAAWLRMGTAVGIPTTLLALVNMSPRYKDDYDKIPEWERRNYWMIPRETKFKNEDTGEDVRDYWRIPKRDVFQLFANTIEAAVRFGHDRNPKEIGEFATNTLGDLSPVNVQGENATERMESVFGSMNPLLKLPAEVATNRDFFRHRDIVPEFMRKAKPEEQYRPSTNEAFIKGGKALGVSPLMLEHVASGATGGALSQFAIRAPQGDRSPLTEYPLFKRFVRSGQVAEDKGRGERLKQAETDDATQAVVRSREAIRLLSSWRGLSDADVEKRIEQVANKDDRLAQKIAEVREEMQKGLTALDKRIRDLGVESGARQKFIDSELQRLTLEERTAWLAELERKGLMPRGGRPPRPVRPPRPRSLVH